MALNTKPSNVRRSRRSGTYILVIILVLLFIGIAALSLFGGGPQRLTSGTTVTLGVGSIASFTPQNSSRDFAVLLRNSSSGYAGILVSTYPVLANPAISIYAASGASYNISTLGTGSANINIKLISSNGTSARIQLTPIPVGLNVGVSSSVTIVQPSSLPTGSLQAPASTTTSYVTTTVTTSVATTTVSGSGATTTVAPTTTIASSVPGSVYATINSSTLGLLMVNLNKLYVAGQACTPTLYKQTLMAYSGLNATGPLSFENVSMFTPSYETRTVKAVPQGYLVSYNITTASLTYFGKVLTFDINGNIVSNTTFEGLWTGLNYTQLNNGYNTQSAVHNICAAFLS